MLSTLQRGGGPSGSSRQPTTTTVPPTTTMIGRGAYIPASGTSCSGGFWSYGGGCIPCSLNPSQCGSPAVMPTPAPRVTTTTTIAPSRSCSPGYFYYLADRGSGCAVCPSVWSASIPFPSECSGYTRRKSVPTTTTTTTSTVAPVILTPATTSAPGDTTQLRTSDGLVWNQLKVASGNIAVSTLKAKLYLPESTVVYFWLPARQAWMRATTSTTLSEGTIFSFPANRRLTTRALATFGLAVSAEQTASTSDVTDDVFSATPQQRAACLLMAAISTQTYGTKLGNGYFAFGDNCYRCPTTYPIGAFLPEDCHGYVLFLLPPHETHMLSSFGDFFQEYGCLAASGFAGWQIFKSKYIDKVLPGKSKGAASALTVHETYKLCYRFGDWLRRIF